MAALNLWYIQHKYQHTTAKSLNTKTKIYLVCLRDLTGHNRTDKDDMLVFVFQNLMDLLKPHGSFSSTSDINSLHKIQITKHSRTRVQSIVPQPRQWFVKGLSWVHANGKVWNVSIRIRGLDIPESNHTRKHDWTREKRVEKWKEIQESCVCNINVPLKRYGNNN